MVVRRRLEVGITDRAHLLFLLDERERVLDLVKLFYAPFAKLPQLNQVFTFGLHAFLVLFLRLDCGFSEGLDALLSLNINVETVGHGDPFGPIHELDRGALATFLIAYDSVVYVDVVHAEGRVFVKLFNVVVLWVYFAVWLYSHGSRLIIQVVVTIQALVSLDRLLQVVLKLGELGLKAD